MSGARSRRKGAQNERLLAKEIQDIFPNDTVRRGLQYQNRFGSEKVPDVECPIFWIEGKVGKKPNPRAALKQAREDCSPGKIPVAVIRDDGAPDDMFIVMGFWDWKDLMKEYIERGER